MRKELPNEKWIDFFQLFCYNARSKLFVLTTQILKENDLNYHLLFMKFLAVIFWIFFLCLIPRRWSLLRKAPVLIQVHMIACGLALLSMTMKLFVIGPRMIRWHGIDLLACTVASAVFYVVVYNRTQGDVHESTVCGYIGAVTGLVYSFFHEQGSKLYDPNGSAWQDGIKDETDFYVYVGGFVISVLLLAIFGRRKASVEFSQMRL